MKKENDIVKKGCHSQEPLLGIFLIPNRCSDLIKERPLCYNNEEAGDPRQKPSGMTHSFITTHGFTLIELLVVVLIIGILAAVAVPQYKKAVVKSRVATILPVLSGIIQAQEVYYLANGQYTDNAQLMDLYPPANCTEIEDDTEGGSWKCGNDFLLDIDAGRVLASYCPKQNNSYTQCKEKRDFTIGFGASHGPNTLYPAPNTRRCWKSVTDFGEEICKTLGKPVEGVSSMYELY